MNNCLDLYLIEVNEPFSKGLTRYGVEYKNYLLFVKQMGIVWDYFNIRGSS